MKRQIILPCLALWALSACAPTAVAPPGARVANEEQAVAIAQTACEAVIGPTESSAWKATLVDGVWWMQRGYEADMQIDALTGAPTECLQTIIVG